MLRVGLTGGLGSGKSTVAEILRTLGAHVIEADALGRDLMQPGQSVYAQIVQLFGEKILLPDGQLDRKALAKIAFEEHRIEELNAIVHPAVIAAQVDWMNSLTDPNAIAVVESALIFETRHGHHADRTPLPDSEDEEIAAAVPNTGWQTRFDRILLITAREDLKIARYIQRVSQGRELTPQERAALVADAKQRLAAQIPDEAKAPLCDYVIDNSADLPTLKAAVTRVFAALKDSAAALTRSTG